MPAEYRVLLLLSLAAFDNFISPDLTASPDANTASRIARETMLDYGCSFLMKEEASLLDIQDFCGKLNSALQCDPFEISIQLAETYLQALPTANSQRLAPILNWPTEIWNNIEAGARLCQQMEQNPPVSENNVYSRFLQKNIHKVTRGIRQPVWEQIDCRQNLYFYFYCTSPEDNLFKPSLSRVDCNTLCRFTFDAASLLYGKIPAILAVLKLFNYFSVRWLPENVAAETIGVYKLALFDRNRKAFTILDNPKYKALLVAPNELEKEVIFNKPPH